MENVIIEIMANVQMENFQTLQMIHKPGSLSQEGSSNAVQCIFLSHQQNSLTKHCKYVFRRKLFWCEVLELKTTCKPKFGLCCLVFPHSFTDSLDIQVCAMYNCQWSIQRTQGWARLIVLHFGEDSYPTRSTQTDGDLLTVMKPVMDLGNCKLRWVYVDCCKKAKRTLAQRRKYRRERHQNWDLSISIFDP